MTEPSWRRNRSTNEYGIQVVRVRVAHNIICGSFKINLAVSCVLLQRVNEQIDIFYHLEVHKVEEDVR